MPRAKQSVPKFCTHKPTNMGYVKLDGVRHYLGRADDPETKRRYDRMIAEWLNAGRRIAVPMDELTIIQLVARWNAHAKAYYSHRRGDPFKTTLAVLVRLYGTTKAADLGPKCLKTVRAEMVAKGWSRPIVNERVQQVRAVFKWGVSEEIVPPLVMEGLRSVIGLKRGRTEAPEPTPVQSVADHVVDQTLPHMTPTVRAMVEFQRATGCRPGEVCVMRTCDLDTSGKVWTFTPSRHKTQHHGRARVVYIGPRGQDLLRPWLKTDLQERRRTRGPRGPARRDPGTPRWRSDQLVPLWTGHHHLPGDRDSRISPANPADFGWIDRRLATTGADSRAVV